jgi:hypothetical protein
MGIFVALLLTTLGICLFILSKKGKIQSDSIQLATNIAGILAFVAAILVFVIPAAQKNDSTAPNIVEAPVIPTNMTKGVNLLPTSTLPSPDIEIPQSPTITSTSPLVTISTPTKSTILVESDHPYADNYKNSWTISSKGANQIRIHFSKLEIAGYDILDLFDKEDNKLTGWCCNTVYEDGLWTEWYTGDTIKLNLTTSGGHNGYGFAVDGIETRMVSKPTSPLPETFHPYADNYKETWTVFVPGANQIRIHFSKLEIAGYDILDLFDKEDNKLTGWCCNTVYEDGVWTEWYTGDTIKLKLTTSGGHNGYGFAVDNIETR